MSRYGRDISLRCHGSKLRAATGSMPLKHFKTCFSYATGLQEAVDIVVKCRSTLTDDATHVMRRHIICDFPAMLQRLRLAPVPDIIFTDTIRISIQIKSQYDICLWSPLPTFRGVVVGCI